MNTRSLTARVVWGTVLVALVTALAGASSATLIARNLWEAHERRVLRDLADGLAAAVVREAAEENSTLDAAASEALREGVAAGHRVEVWRGSDLVASNSSGAPIGLPGARPAEARDSWLAEARPLPGGMRLYIAAPRERMTEALRIFGWSLVLSAPICVILAALIGRLVGRRAARPIVEFKNRIGAARPFDVLPPVPRSDLLEVQELDASFRALWDRLREAMAREVEFTANAAHELRTPLTRIRLSAERAGAAAGAAPSQDLRELIAEIDRLVQLVDSLLVLARDAALGIPAGEVVNVSDVTAAAVRRVFSGVSSPHLEAPDETLVRGDEALLGIAVENLLDNARKFSPAGLTPRVVVEGDARGVRLCVRSPGTRLPRADAERLFERFYRGPGASTRFAGQGLGLPLARHIARLHGGEVRCVPDPEDEACFELSLPAWQPLPP